MKTPHPLNSNFSFMYFIIIFLLIFLVKPSNQCSLQDPQFLVTFHPHLDAFWLNTDDQLKNINFRPAGFLYAMNQRNSKQIFNSMLLALTQNQKRKYFISQIVFFKDWYDYLSPQRQQIVKNLVKNGQIDVSNSGWVQNDQAVCYYDDILDQYTIGMNWMYETFGYVNKIGWATDSFGHSHSQVALQHLLGFQFQGIQRIDDRYIYQRKGNPLLEFYWQPVSDSNGRKYGGLLNQVRHFLHEVNDLRRNSPSGIANDFKYLQQNMKGLYKKNKMFRFLGNDFEQFTKQEFQNLQKSFDQLNANSKAGCANYKYGNPKDYLNLVKPYWSQHKLQVRQHDFMPNWDQDRYWSGYFTTDPDLKIICKWYSRLINLFRKRVIKQSIIDKTVYANYAPTLQKAEELLSIMQHHDGITATSKAHIQNLFKQRMANSSKQLIQILQKITKIQPQQTCRFFENRNVCNITLRQPQLTLSILHQGVNKKERIQLNLPQQFVYSVQGIQSFIIFSPNKASKTLIFQAQLKSGKNDFVLKGMEQQLFKNQVKEFVDKQNYFDNNQGVKVSLTADQAIRYQFGENYFQFSYQSSKNQASRRQTMSWSKYGQKSDKTQTVIPGIYIMSNNGKLDQVTPNFRSIKVVSFSNWQRVFIDGQKIHVTLTFKKDDPSHIEYDFTFTPNGYNMADYFLKINSNVISPSNQFYHDSNGYLVAKRKIGQRPDYDWTYKIQDKINANTYPACTFFYQLNQQEKFVVFLDRALGVTTYDGSMLVNIDRLAGDDYKGVGQGYSYIKENHFRFKFSLTSKNDDIQRIQQRRYDQSLVGFIHVQQASRNQANLRKTPDVTHQYLKYSLHFLNSQQILLRIHNLGERTDLKIPHYQQKSWSIEQLNLNITYASIRQSFANGLIFKQRYNWIGDEEEINHLSRGKKDSSQQIILSPLQIRSFRINLKEEIKDKEIENEKISNLTPQQIKKVDATEAKALVKHSLRKRCFL